MFRIYTMELYRIRKIDILYANVSYHIKRRARSRHLKSFLFIKINII